MDPSPEVVSKLKDAVSRGIGEEESRRGRRSLLWSAAGSVGGLAFFVLFLHFVVGDRKSVSWRVPAAFVATSVALAALQYRRLVPRPPQEQPEMDVVAMARLYALCPSCGELTARYSLGCAACGALRRPRAAAVGVAVLAVATVAVLVAIWLKSGRY